MSKNIHFVLSSFLSFSICSYFVQAIFSSSSSSFLIFFASSFNLSILKFHLPVLGSSSSFVLEENIFSGL